MIYLQILINSILLGGIYACIAVGFSLVWGVMNILNILHGTFLMLGGYITFWLFKLYGVDPFLSLPVSAAVMFCSGYVIQRGLINKIVREMLSEVGEMESARLGRPGVPAYWRSLARNRHYFESTWKKHRLMLDGGVLDPEAKAAVDLGVSATNGSRYFIRYFHAALVNIGWEPGRILEIFGVVDHYNSFNALATGMQIESDIKP